LQSELDLLVKENNLPAGVTSTRHCGSGIIEFDIDISSLINNTSISSNISTSGYACSRWTFRVGGKSLDGFSPVTVRSISPLFAHYAADDLGIPDARFWKSSNEQISLRDLMHRTVTMLLGPFPDNNSSDSNKKAEEEWGTAQTYTYNKSALIASYASQAVHPLMIASGQDCATSDISQWFAPSFVQLIADVKKTRRQAQEQTLEQHEETVSTSWRSLVTEESPGIFSFDLFTPEFCTMVRKKPSKY
jgi:hypothetical protein